MPKPTYMAVTGLHPVPSPQVGYGAGSATTPPALAQESGLTNLFSLENASGVILLQ